MDSHFLGPPRKARMKTSRGGLESFPEWCQLSCGTVFRSKPVAIAKVERIVAQRVAQADEWTGVDFGVLERMRASDAELEGGGPLEVLDPRFAGNRGVKKVRAELHAGVTLQLAQARLELVARAQGQGVGWLKGQTDLPAVPPAIEVLEIHVPAARSTGSEHSSVGPGGQAAECSNAQGP